MTTTTKLGSTGPAVFPIGLGCMGMSGMYGASSDDEGVATIQEAIERGVTLIDTGDFYGMGHNEMLVGRAIRGRRDKVTLSVKFGAMRDPAGAFVGFDGRPAAVQNSLAYTLKRLGVDHVDVYRPARLDPQVPIEDTVGAIADLVKKGWVRHVGLSEVGVDTIRKAHAVSPVADLQIEYSIVTRGAEEKIFPVLHELGISATLYGVLSRGLLGGKSATGKGDFRAFLPRFSEANRERNDRVVKALADFAAGRKQTAAQLCLSWVLAREPKFVPILGSRTREQLVDLLDATKNPLSPAELRELESLVPKDAIAGSRYQEAQMAHLDSEK
ncbi:MAG: aldo/keto reductase [Polyangiaceae bacterium]